MRAVQNEKGEQSPRAHRARLASAVKAALSRNPFAYPRIFAFDNENANGGSQILRFWSGRFDDVLATADRYYSMEIPFQGLVTANRALGEIFRLLAPEDQAIPVTLIDVGKLRTNYLGGQHGEVAFSHTIPVGLARDDAHYFRSISPTLSYLEAINSQQGTLLFPPDATPSPIFDPAMSTPQIDCTRFAMQVARYAYRVLHDIWPTSDALTHGAHYVSGGASRLPGFRPYMEAKTSARYRRLDRRPVPGIQILGDVTWADVADHLLMIGAAVAYHRRTERLHGLVLRDRRPVRVNRAGLRGLNLEPGQLYVLEKPVSE
ncbi:hypothetical protein HZA57_04935 [Candidatus Poribacteria bacterium]|nr:hypothetical protein [Candidatus Poribacteria bacterium]